MMNCSVLKSFAIVASSNPRCAFTSAGGVNASHYEARTQDDNHRAESYMAHVPYSS